MTFMLTISVQGNYTFTGVTIQDGDLPSVLPASDYKLRISGVTPTINILILYVEAKINGKGAPEGQMSDALAVASINKTLG